MLKFLVTVMVFGAVFFVQACDVLQENASTVITHESLHQTANQNDSLHPILSSLIDGTFYAFITFIGWHMAFGLLLIATGLLSGYYMLHRPVYVPPVQLPAMLVPPADSDLFTFLGNAGG